jgi:flagellin-like protein
MKFKQLLTDDDAVSPVIGVILMVAITVILAAVIASFVLGLGDSADEVQPNSSFNFDYDASGPTVDITLTDGDSVLLGNMYARGQNLDGTGELELDTSGDVASTSGGLPAPSASGFGANTEWSPGQTITIDVNGDAYQFDLVWETSEDSTTLQSNEGPDA